MANGCERCKTKGKVKRGGTGGGRKRMTLCPNCQGFGKIRWSKRESKRFACRLVTQMIDNVMDCGFPLNEIHETNTDSVYDCLGDILMEMYKRSGEMGGIRNAKKVNK